MDVNDALRIGQLQEHGTKIAGYFIAMQAVFFVLSIVASYTIAPWQGLSPSAVLPYAVIAGAVANLVGFIIGCALGLKIGWKG